VTRMIVARILVVLAAVFAVLALVAGYIRFQALDNETFRGTAEDLIADKEVRDQIAASLVEQLFANVDVTAALEERLPPDQDRLAAPLASVTREFADRAAVRLFDRPRPQQLWVESLARTHEQVLRALDDELALLRTEEGLLVLNLEPLVVELGERLAVVGNIADRVPEGAGRIEIMEADQLEAAQELTRLLKILGSFLWIVPFALAGLAVWIARGRRRSIVTSLAVASIITGLVVLVVRSLAGDYVVDELVANPSARPAVADAWDIITAQLTDGGRTLLGLGAVMLLGLWLAGPSRSGAALRARAAPWLERPEIAFGGAAVALLLLVWWGPTVQTRRWYGVLAFAVLLGIGVEVLRRISAREQQPAAEQAPDVVAPSSP
jgi:uncharacterized membrane protein